jgi:hypothetical protein
LKIVDINKLGAGLEFNGGHYGGMNTDNQRPWGFEDAINFSSSLQHVCYTGNLPLYNVSRGCHYLTDAQVDTLMEVDLDRSKQYKTPEEVLQAYERGDSQEKGVLHYCFKSV